ncbi:hypothetical protein ACFVKB_00905 [Rhodococcus sp. NPDC127530]|uniref:hypothetical protein n=1 Tax=unclassified Rhodococcus (in: high G+C Gram-positive bacteria) TaxID=192944 RepID=UPI003633D88B
MSATRQGGQTLIFDVIRTPRGRGDVGSGDRFLPPRLLLDKAAAGGTFDGVN